MPAGRPTKYTEERAEAILAAMATGIGKEVAARSEGVCIDTLNNWAKRRPNFSALLDIADARFERSHAARVGAASAGPTPGDWKVSAWILERKYHERWGRKQTVDSTVSGPAGGPVQTETTIVFKRVGAPASAEADDDEEPGDTTPDDDPE